MMKKYVILCLVALLVGASAEFSYTIIESTEDSVIFEYECQTNVQCKDPGEGYCGDGEVRMMFCAEKERCEITCYPMSHENEDVFREYSNIDITPEEKKNGDPLLIELTDSRYGTPLMYEIEVYSGGYWEIVSTQGPIHIATGKWGVLEKPFTTSRWVHGDLFTELETDRWGKANFTLNAPGYWSIRTIGTDLAFLVGDEAGDTFYCGDDTCETWLGENEMICPKDCNDTAEVEPIIPDIPIPDEPEDPMPSPSDSVCGNGNCEVGETSETCPADCTGPVNPPQTGPTNQTTQPAAQPGGPDMGLVTVIVLLIVVMIMLLVVLFMKMGKKPTGTRKVGPSRVCSKCGTGVSQGDTFCVKCGNKV